MNRRQFLSKAGLVLCSFGLVGCGREQGSGLNESLGLFTFEKTVTLYDTHAMALYFDGGLGPQTGIIKVDYILADKPVTLEFWHGHGGVNHKFTVTPAHFHDLKQLKKVFVDTTEVAQHTHRLFIDPNDTRYRVTGAKPVAVPVEDRKAGA